MLRHKRCKGQVIISISNYLRVISPGVRFSPDGLQPGIVELQKIGKSKSPIWLCKKCEEEFTTKEELEQVEIECLACEKFHPVSEILVTSHGLFDEECHAILTGNFEGPLDEYFEHLKRVLEISITSSKAQLSELMLKPINL